MSLNITQKWAFEFDFPKFEKNVPREPIKVVKY